MRHCTRRSRTDRSSRFCTIHNLVPTHPDPLVHNPITAFPEKSPDTAQERVQIVRFGRIESPSDSRWLHKIVTGTAHAPSSCVSGGSVGRLKQASNPTFRKEGRGFRPESLSGSAAWFQASQPGQRRNAEGQPRGVPHGEGHGRRGCEGIPTLRGGKTRRSSSPRGARIGRGPTRLDRHRTCGGEQSPEGEGVVSWSKAATRNARRA